MMHCRILLMLWIISFLFFGFVISESSTSTTTVSSSTTELPSTSESSSTTGLSSTTGSTTLSSSTSTESTATTVGVTSNPESADEKIKVLFFFGEERLCSVLNSNVPKFFTLLGESDEFKERFVPILLGNDTSTDEITSQLLNDNDQKDKIINNLLNDATTKQKLMGNINETELAKVTSKRSDAIDAIAENNEQMNSFLVQDKFRKSFIKNILGKTDYKNELLDEIGGEEINAHSNNGGGGGSNLCAELSEEKSLHLLLKKNPGYALKLKLLILSPMIIAWTASLICISSMCGVCYPFGLSEPSAKSKEKKAKKSTDEKKNKKKRGSKNNNS